MRELCLAMGRLPSEGINLMWNEAARRTARTRLGQTGLTLLLVGVVGAAAAGVTLGMLLIGHPQNASTLRWLLLVFAGGGLLVAVFGNYIWHRARLADQRRNDQS